MARGVKGIHQNLWNDISFQLPAFSHLVFSVVGVGKEMNFWEDHSVGDRSISFAFSWLYHLSPFKNLHMSDFWFGWNFAKDVTSSFFD